MSLDSVKPSLLKYEAVTWLTLHKIMEGNVISLSEAVVVLIEVTVPDVVVIQLSFENLENPKSPNW